MRHKNYQIKISLKGSKPKIWRRIILSADTLLEDFHKIIQTTMGWTNSHLHQFIKNKTYYTYPLEDDDLNSYDNSVDYIKKKIRVEDLLVIEKDKIIYEYDFGDGWEHEILLEKINLVDLKMKIPVCVAGKMECPPEDCGGIWGYYNLLEVMQNPKHPDYKDTREWFEGDLDSEYFDKDEINELLKEEDFGALDFLAF